VILAGAISLCVVLLCGRISGVAATPSPTGLIGVAVLDVYLSGPAPPHHGARVRMASPSVESMWLCCTCWKQRSGPTDSLADAAIVWVRCAVGTTHAVSLASQFLTSGVFPDHMMPFLVASPHLLPPNCSQTATGSGPQNVAEEKTGHGIGVWNPGYG
jgi:hypothetical protein